MRRLLAWGLGSVLVPVLGSGVGSAHVRTQSPEAPAGSRYTFSFEVDHGCDGSPTTGLRILLPEGAFDARPVEKAGWTATADGDPVVVEFAGGPLPDATTDSFSVELVTPNRPGEEVLFPTVQRCAAGETSWVDPDAATDTPAPRVLLTANATPITAPPTTTTTTTTTPPTTATPSPADDDGGGSGGFAVPALIGAVAAAGAGLAVWSGRRRRR